MLGVSVLAVVLSSPSLRANSINFSIQVLDGSSVWGSGIVSAAELGNTGNYLATSGSLQLTGGPFSPFDGALVPNPNSDGSPWNPIVYGGTQFIGLDDLIVQTGPSTYGLDQDGLLFNDPSFATGGGYGLVGNPYDYSGGNVLFNGYANDPWASNYGGLTITVTNIPDGGTTAALLGFGVVGCALVSRKLKKA